MIYLNLGCGKKILPGFDNLDTHPGPGGIECDLTKRLPYNANSVSAIYSEHFIEHLHRGDAVRLLEECHRVLLKGGVIRLVTPNLEELADAYLSADPRRFDGNEGEWKPMTACQMMNEGMRYWGHLFLYDSPELIKVLSEAGFKKVWVMEHGKSILEKFNGLDSRKDFNDIYLEAQKI